MTHKVPLISQEISLCWEACGRILWGFYYGTNAKSWKNYATRAGNYAKMKQGLVEARMCVYYKKLGLRSLQNASGKNIRHALKWTPVIIPWINASKTSGHAMVVIDHKNSKYTIENPCEIQIMDFDSPSGSSCTAKIKTVDESYIDNNLGQYIWYW